MVLVVHSISEEEDSTGAAEVEETGAAEVTVTWVTGTEEVTVGIVMGTEVTGTEEEAGSTGQTVVPMVMVSVVTVVE